MRRLVLALVAAVLLAACSTTLVPRDDVPDLVRAAFRSAGVKTSEVSVSRSRDGHTWKASTTANGIDVSLVIDAEAGRITRINLGDSTAISRAQLREIARYESNAANDRARTRQRAMTLVVVVALVAGGLLLARHFRLREERELAEKNEEP